jgi:carbamoyl-phosphate synthase small subunit
MKYIDQKPGVLLLEDGNIFHGNSIGQNGIAVGELCFNTGMTGYQEVFTDPSYYGQLMINTNVHIGNYGANYKESESEKMQISGLICRNFNTRYSRVVADMDLKQYFIDQKKIVLSNVDTRAVVRHIRDKGAMNGIISTDILDIDVLKQKLKEVPSMEGLELSSKVSTKKEYSIGEDNKENYKVAVLDFGVKKNILNCLLSRGCYLRVFPMDTSYEEMLDWGPDAFFLSNGPGDPSSMPDVIKEVQKITLDGRPVFGICLGHQILALSEGVSTYKMHNGHRGINHPVINLKSGKAEVTSQNHGFGISSKDIEKSSEIKVTHINLNDDTIEGIELINKNCFSVQFHPESSPGPHDSRYLFDEFIERIENYIKNK